MKELKNREAWYSAAAEKLGQAVFKPVGYELPRFRIGCGFPVGSRKAIGQCFGEQVSKDKTYEIFVSPVLNDPVVILEVLIHELSHAVAGTKAGHKKPFIEVMRAVGMVKPWKQSHAGADLIAVLDTIQEKLGPYPHAELVPTKREGKKQTTRLLKVQCPECEYVVRVTRKWLDEVGAPLCPVHKVAFREAEKK